MEPITLTVIIFLLVLLLCIGIPSYLKHRNRKLISERRKSLQSSDSPNQSLQKLNVEQLKPESIFYQLDQNLEDKQIDEMFNELHSRQATPTLSDKKKKAKRVVMPGPKSNQSKLSTQSGSKIEGMVVKLPPIEFQKPSFKIRLEMAEIEQKSTKREKERDRDLSIADLDQFLNEIN